MPFKRPIGVLDHGRTAIRALANQDSTTTSQSAAKQIYVKKEGQPITCAFLRTIQPNPGKSGLPDAGGDSTRLKSK